MFRLFGPLFGIAILVLWALTIASIIRTPDHAYRAGNQIVWLLVVILAAPVGVPLYWILGSPQTR